VWGGGRWRLAVGGRTKHFNLQEEHFSAEKDPRGRGYGAKLIGSEHLTDKVFST